MKIAPPHPEESKRIMALKKLEILDTDAEKEFDDIAQVAKLFFQVSMVTISFVDEHRQWFKSKVGINIQGTDRKSSFCSHTILQKDIFIVPDTLKDERFYDNPNVTDGIKLRFYAGFPILDPETHLPVATLCLLDTVPRDLDENQKFTLRALAHQVQKLIELKVKVKSIAELFKKTTFQRVSFETMTEGIVIHDDTGRIVDYNQSALNILNVTEDQIKGLEGSHWVTIKENGEPYPVDERPAALCLQTGSKITNSVLGIKFEAEQVRWISVNVSPIFLEQKAQPTHVVATFIDITQKRLDQQKLVQAAKLTTVGELTGEIAHEINSPLAIINLAAYQALKNLESEKTNLKLITQKLKLVESTVQRISLIISGLKNFVRSSEKTPMIETVSVQKVIEDTLILIEDKYKKANITLTVDTRNDCEIKCVPTLLSQVILNLLNNSFDAIQGYVKPWVKIMIQPGDEIIKITVMDSGAGIPPEVQAMIMEPFFTTKEQDGTGLGLSISQDIIESINGKLYYELINKNTTFTIELPCVHKI